MRLHRPSHPHPQLYMNAVLTMTPHGNVSCLYTELIDLSSLGRLEIQRASTIKFNIQSQRWEVKDRRGTLLFFARSRQSCVDWEQTNL